MKVKDVLKCSLEKSEYVMTAYFESLSDEEIMMRPAKNANHMAWQLGHLVLSEHSMMSAIAPGSMPELPEGFAEKHSKEASTEDSTDKFCSKAEYLELMGQMRKATLSLLAEIDEARLDEEGPEFVRAIAPKVGNLFALCAEHYYMHSGQVAVLRRKLEKPIVI